MGLSREKAVSVFAFILGFLLPHILPAFNFRRWLLKRLFQTPQKQLDAKHAYDPYILLSWWFHGKESTNLNECPRQSYSEAARKRWFTITKEARDRVDSFIHTHYSLQMGQAERWAKHCLQEKDFSVSGEYPSECEWIKQWRETTMGSLALVILLDQFSRHEARERQRQGMAAINVEQCSLCARIEVALRWQGISTLINQELESSEWPTRFVQDRDSVLQHSINTLDTSQLVFLLLPFRHGVNDMTDALESIEIRRAQLRMVLKLVADREDVLQGSEDLTQRFRKQTQRTLNGVDDVARAPSATPLIDGEGVSDDDLLERVQFQADESQLMQGNHRLLKTMDAFLQQHLTRHDGPPTLVLSLSGGVDSMVLLKLLSCQWLKQRHRNYRIVSLHLNYGNRQEANREAAFVQRYAEELGSVVETLCLGGGRNNGTMSRDEYEKYSRNMRYGWYKERAHFFDAEGVMLAHHLGDVEENVLSNVMHGNLPDQLSGMREIGNVEGCPVWRPLLPHRKDLIYEFAHTYGVPYFLDSTPSWSTRYAIRRKLLPLIRDVYGDGANQNLASLAQASDNLHDELHNRLIEPFIAECVQQGNTGFRINAADRDKYSLFWWRMILLPLLHSIGNPMLSEKALGVLSNRLYGDSQNGSTQKKSNRKKTQQQPKDGWLELRKEWPTYFSQGNFLILKQALLPSVPLTSQGHDKTEPHTPEGSPLNLPSIESITTHLIDEGKTCHFGQAVRWGPWHVKAGVCRPSAVEHADSLQQLMIFSNSTLQDWNELKTANKLAAALRTDLAPELLAGMSSIQEETRQMKESFADFNFDALLSGEFRCFILVPMPNSHKDLSGSLSMQTESRLLPYRAFDRMLRRIIPPVGISDQLADDQVTVVGNRYGHLLVCIEYSFARDP